MNAQTLLESITKVMPSVSEISPAVRDTLLVQVDKLRLALETPMETAFRIGYQPWQHAAVRLAIEMNIFPILTASEHAKISLDDMALQTKADTVLLVRLLRMLVALGLCSGNPQEGYYANDKTAVFTVPTGRDSFKIWADLGVPTSAEFSKYFRSHRYVNPEHAADSPFASAFGTEFWMWKSQNPEYSATFDSFMSSRRKGRKHWFELYPIEERLLGPANGQPLVLVDVGGGRGHDLMTFRDTYSNWKGELILQDLPEVIAAGAEDRHGITTIPHNFFEVQPVKGAKAYVFRAIFHDWATESCRIILRQIADAMAPGYSKLLISDFVLDDTDPHIFSSSIDLQMMGLHAGMERSKKQWEDLLASVGLQITTIFQPSKNNEAVIEAELSAKSGEAK